jgi:tetratricopeptide (TPR) repeat protein
MCTTTWGTCGGRKALQGGSRRSYAEALRRNPQHAPAWRGLGDLYREFGDHPQAVACYQVPQPFPASAP